MKPLALLLFAASLAAQVPGPISIHAGCTQTLNPTVGAYSGNLAITAWQFGFISVNVATGSQLGIQFKNGVWKPMLGGCSGRSDLSFVGDCWQSVINLTASNGAPKWLITPGAPTDCQKNGLMVWKWNGTAFDVVGLISPPAGKQVRRLGTAVLSGDSAWVELTQNVGWVPCDLNAGTCNWSLNLPSPPAGEGRQSGVGGFQYNVGIDYSHPNVDGGPQWFWMIRADQPTPTRPPAPTATRTVTGAARTLTPTTPTRTATYSQCPPFCPPTSTRTPIRTLTSAASATPSASPTVPVSRFNVAVTWTKPDGTTGTGASVCSSSSGSDSSSVYSFFSSANWELQVEVQPSYCSQTGHVMVKIGGTTNVAVDVTITDRQTGFSKVYSNPQGQLFKTVIDGSYEVCQ